MKHPEKFTTVIESLRTRMMVNVNGRTLKKCEYRQMKIIYVVNDAKTEMSKIGYMQKKYYTPRLICWTLHDHNGMVMH